MERQRRVAELFAAVLEKGPKEQTVFLKKECGEDAAMLAEIRELLGAFSEAQANDFMSAPALESEAEYLAEDEETDARIGQVLGRYKIVEKIGAGGMGAIYLAERSDAEIEKRAAVKIIKRGMDTDAILRRFRNERQILANLEHPNIAHLLDAGTTVDALPFFVMEYIDGMPIDEYCQTNNLSETERLELFRKVCAAVSFAHQKLIVHRDLKPSNILVSAEGEPKLLDFGIAKLLNSSEANQTQTNMRVLTPAYASPEQQRGEIVSTASDVYSLGLILAEMLEVQSSKFKAQSSTSNSEIKDQKSKLKDQNLNRDLQNILAKSLREDTARRYQSVEQFSEDVRRYLSGLPVTARQDSFSYRASKFIQRNRVAAAIAVLFVVSLIGGLAATYWQFRQAQSERARAERRFNDVRGLVNTFLSELNDEMVKVPGNTAARKLLVQRTLEYLDNASRESGDDAALKRELATAYIKIGDLQGNSYYQNFGDTSAALASYQKALDILESLVQINSSDAETKIQLAKGYESTGDVLWDKGDINATRDNYQKALKIVEQVAAKSEDKETQIYLAQLYTALGDIEYLIDAPCFKDISAALEYLHKGLAIRERLLAVEPDNKVINISLDQSYHRLTNIYHVKGDFASEFEFLQKDKAITEKLLAAYPKEPNRKRAVWALYAQFERYLIDAGDFKQAAEYAAKSMALREEIYNADKTEVRARRDLAFGYYSSAILQTETGDFPGALANYQKQLKIYEELAAIDASNKDRQRDLIGGLTNVGNAFVKTGDASAALENFKRALELAQNFPNNDVEMQNSLAAIYEGIGSALLKAGKTDEAIENFQKAIELRESEIKNDSQNTPARADLAKNYLEAGKSVERIDKQSARELYQKSLEVWNVLRQQNALRKIDEKKLEETSAALARL